MENNSGNGQVDRIFMNLKTKLTPGVILTLSWGYIHVYDLCSQTSLLVYISGERLHDHWSSSFCSSPTNQLPHTLITGR